MIDKFLPKLLCPSCGADLERRGDAAIGCKGCRNQYPVLAGVLVLVEDVHGYVVEHAKGISRHVADAEIPKKMRDDYLEAKAALAEEHIEEDLEAERVTALYVMNHYLRSREVSSPDPALDEIIKRHWDHGPFSRIAKLLEKGPRRSLIELGCGVGGLYAALQDRLELYLGLDQSFASIALARHLALGARFKGGGNLVPEDLLHGAVSRKISVAAPKSAPANAEFIVCDLSAPPVKPGAWQVTAALNVIDMLPEPEALPRLQHALLEPRGLALQSCPYIWHPEVARHLRETLPKKALTSSAEAVEHLYRAAGFKIDSSDPHVPWVFFKNIRQLEIYSVHLFCASKV